MEYQKELLFLCGTFQKCHVTARIVEQSDFEAYLTDPPLYRGEERNDLFGDFLSNLQPQTLYRLNDMLECRHCFLKLPHAEQSTVLCIGPYLSSPVSAKALLEFAERQAITGQQRQHLEEYFAGLPVIADDSALWIMLNNFCEIIWKSEAFAIRDIAKNAPLADLSFITLTSEDSPTDTLVKVKNMERRYAFENELIRAVELGQVHKEAQLFTAFSDHLFEKRVADPLRNVKNYGIIMNTLLRKAAERGGVHPVHLNQISSGFARKIEQLPSISKNFDLMCEMFRDYCRLVRKHSLKKFSPVVQRAILMMESNLSTELSPHMLAESQGISLGYLSTVFKKETGKTPSEYLRDRRMEYATHLLQNTNLQIQTVALYCGIMDVQYFSKLFKRQFGIPPSEYRASLTKAEHNPSRA